MGIKHNKPKYPRSSAKREYDLRYSKQYYRENKDRIKEWKKEYRAKNRDKIKEYKRKYRAINEDYRKQEFISNKNRRLKKEYGISLQDYDRLCREQKNTCAICSQKKEGEMLIVDHNHKTKKFRGLLCSNCNKGLGFFKDNFELLEKARDYLRS